MVESPEPDPQKLQIRADLIQQGLIPGTWVFESILQGRMQGWNKETCKHPKWILDGQFLICLQCGLEEMT